MPARPEPETPFAALDGSPLLAGLDARERERFLGCAERVDLAPGASLSGEAVHQLSLVLRGSATLRRAGGVHRRLGPGDHFGELALVGGRPGDEAVDAGTALALLRVSGRCWAELERRDPPLAAKVAMGIARALGDELSRATGDVGLLLRGRSLPRAPEITVRVGGEERRVRTGTRLTELLPPDVDGDLVVAGLLGQKPVSLSTPIFTDAAVAPLTASHWEGRQIYAHSVGLLLLEAAHQVAPGVRVQLGPSRGTRQVVEVSGQGGASLEGLAGEIAAAMARLAAADLPFRLEFWSTEEAASWFRERGWEEAARLLRTRRQATVRLVSCGEVYALSMGPLLPATGRIRGFTLRPGDEGLDLQFGRIDPRNGHGKAAPRPRPRPRDGDMAREHERWLAAMGVDSVGAFNDLCVSGQVSQLIRVGEGFHEKRIGQIADRIAAARDRIRVISIAGPSSSGKTTFIRRLTVQLQIDGVNPIGISLDDYYVDREKTPRSEGGDWDFEALEALDLALFQEHVSRLLAGEAVRTARYDFLTGRSHPEGGPVIHLRPGDALMLEGIHGLNPGLLGAIPRPGELFRVFVHPATTLPFDRLTRVSATDLRLLRRIIRDRHQRGYSAADNILRWPSVQAGEREHIFPYQDEADAVFDTALIYEPAVLKVFAERYLLEVPQNHPAYATAHRLRYLVDRFVSIYPDHVPPTSIIREFIGGSGFEY
ncbi:MAG TPA: cyclic nucleotide-binding protein [Anaeromyxobacter sp.]